MLSLILLNMKSSTRGLITAAPQLTNNWTNIPGFQVAPLALSNRIIERVFLMKPVKPGNLCQIAIIP